MGICVSCRRRDLQAPDKRAGGAGGGRVPAKGAAAELLPRRADPAMANSISNIKMTNPIKGIVSKRRKRYIKDGFNLDLAYITDRLIAMGFPAEKLEGVYRNHIDEVYRFLEQMHKDHYKIYNLCSERCYDSSKFHGRVARYAFEDHTPPKMELIQPFCEDVHKWLSADARNVAAVHCKAGKGRTGTMVCCYLLYSGQKATADEALKFYGTKRTHDEKGVTIPSQRRYVEYYAALVGGGLQYSATKLHIRELLMAPPPALNGGQCTLELTVSQAAPPLKGGSVCQEGRRQDSVRLVLEQCTPLQGDVRVDVYNKPKMMMRKEKLFHFWFNTFFVANCVGAVRVPPPADSMNLDTFKLTLNKWQLDDAHKDKQHKLYSPDFKVEVTVQQQPASSRFSACGRAHSPASCSADSDPDCDEHWDSGELVSASRLQPRTSTSHSVSTDFACPGSLTDENIPTKCTPDVCLERYMRLSDTSSSDCSKFSDRSPSVRYGSLTPSESSTMSTTRLLDPNDRKVAYAILSTDTEMPCDVCVRNEKPCRFENKLSDPAETLKYFEHTDVCMQSIAEHDAKKCDAPGKFTNDGYMLIDRSPRPQNQLIRLSDPSHSKLTFGPNKCTRLSDPTGKSKCLGAMGTVTKDGYMLVDATPRQPNVKMDRSRLPTTSTDAMLSEATNRIPERSEEYMEFTATDGYMRASETGPAYKEEYAFICSDLDAQPDCDDRKCKLVEMSESKSDDSSEGNLPNSAQCHESKGKNKKHSFFKRDEYKTDKGKIPKVSSDHTISDDSKKKYMFFYKRDEEGSKPRLTLGDIRGSWREFSGKWSDNRKKKDRDDS